MERARARREQIPGLPQPSAAAAFGGDAFGGGGCLWQRSRLRRRSFAARRLRRRDTKKPRCSSSGAAARRWPRHHEGSLAYNMIALCSRRRSRVAPRWTFPAPLPATVGRPILGYPTTKTKQLVDRQTPDYRGSELRILTAPRIQKYSFMPLIRQTPLGMGDADPKGTFETRPRAGSARLLA